MKNIFNEMLLENFLTESTSQDITKMINKSNSLDRQNRNTEEFLNILLAAYKVHYPEAKNLVPFILGKEPNLSMDSSPEGRLKVFETLVDILVEAGGKFILFNEVLLLTFLMVNKNQKNEILAQFESDPKLDSNLAKDAIVKNGIFLKDTLGFISTSINITSPQTLKKIFKKMFQNLSSFYFVNLKQNAKKKMQIISLIEDFKIFNTQQANQILSILIDETPEVEPEVSTAVAVVAKEETGTDLVTVSNKGELTFGSKEVSTNQSKSEQVNPDSTDFDPSIFAEIDKLDNVSKATHLKQMKLYYSKIPNTAKIINYVELGPKNILQVLVSNQTEKSNLVKQIGFELGEEIYENDSIDLQDIDKELKTLLADDKKMKDEGTQFPDFVRLNKTLVVFLSSILEVIVIHLTAKQFAIEMEKAAKDHGFDIDKACQDTKSKEFLYLVATIESKSQDFYYDAVGNDPEKIKKSKEYFIEMLTSRFGITQEQYAQALKDLEEFSKGQTNEKN